MKTEIKNIETSAMGTVKFDMKAKGHRGFQNFICYPINKSSKYIKIQSDKRMGVYYPNKEEMHLSKSRAGGSYFHHLSLDTLTIVKLDSVENQELKMRIFTSASSEAGKKENGFIHSDNSGAINVFDL